MNRRRRHHHGDTSSEIKRVDDNRFSASYNHSFDKCTVFNNVQLTTANRPVRSNLSSKVTLLTGENPRKWQGDALLVEFMFIF